MRWARAMPRTSASSRSRSVPASSKRSWSASDAHPGAQRGHHVAGVAGQGVDGVLDDRGILLHALGAGAGSAAAAHVGERARPDRAGGGQPLDALAQRDDLVDGGDGGLGRAAAAERADVAGAVAAHLADDGQPRERLDGELDPGGPLGGLGAPVVARLVLGDEAQLAHLGLERGGADDRGDALGEPHHLGHPGALLGGGEVAAHPGADVDRGADVEDPAVAVLEEVDARLARAGRRRASACGAGRG